MKKVFILGATSPTGKVLLNHLQSTKNLDITCYVRSPEKLSSFKNLKIIQGDITDQPSLSKSMKGMDIIITLLSGDTDNFYDPSRKCHKINERKQHKKNYLDDWNGNSP